MNIDQRLFAGLFAAILLTTGLRTVGADWAEAPDRVQPLGVGERVPQVDLRTPRGEIIALQDVLDGAPTALVFFRGGWCPFCTRHLSSLQDIIEPLQALNVQLVAISPDTMQATASTIEDSRLSYPVLGDPDMAAIRAFGLAFKVDPKTVERYREYGIPLRSPAGVDAKVLPVPAVYLVDRDGAVRFVHFNPDYRTRLDAHAVLAAARNMADADAAGRVRTEPLIYRDGDTVLEGALAYPANTQEPRPGVIVFHEWYGLNDYARRRARQLAQLGYVALAADVYGKGIRASSASEAGKLAGKYKGDRLLMRSRVKAALAALRTVEACNADAIAAIGYCFGGTCALELARSGADIRGAVSFHGGLGQGENVENESIAARILVCHGAADPHVPEKELDAFRTEMRDAGADWVLVMYGGAVHSFTNPRSGSRPSTGVAYDPLADLRSWRHMRQFFDEIFSPID